MERLLESLNTKHSELSTVTLLVWQWCCKAWNSWRDFRLELADETEMGMAHQILMASAMQRKSNLEQQMVTLTKKDMGS